MTTRKSITFALGVASVAAVAARTASAQTISFDENGKGTFTRPGGVPVPLISLGNQPDPLEPTLTPLTYDLLASGAFPPVVRGDVLISEVATANVPSDLLRFLPNGRMLVYSDKPEAGETPALADIGLPTFIQDNRISFIETGPENGTNGLFGYMPTPNQPGFFANAAGGGPTYNFFSDGTLPEPASLAVTAIAGCAALVRPRRRRQTGPA